MGRHSAQEEPPPPKEKPRYRFLVAIAGIALLAFFTMATVAAIFPERPQASATEQPPPANPFPEVSGPGDTPTPGPDSPAPGSTQPSGQPPTNAPVPPVVPSVTAAGSSPVPGSGPTGATNPPSGVVGGQFAVATAWETGFIAGVQLTNATTTAQSWQVTLVLPDGVGVLDATWISGGPGGSTYSRNGQTVVFTGVAPLAAGSGIGLNFQFRRAAGPFQPTSCAVNSRPCSGL